MMRQQRRSSEDALRVVPRGEQVVVGAEQRIVRADVEALRHVQDELVELIPGVGGPGATTTPSSATRSSIEGWLGGGLKRWTRCARQKLSRKSLASEKCSAAIVSGFRRTVRSTGAMPITELPLGIVLISISSSPMVS
jgi:hypothetical protein